MHGNNFSVCFGVKGIWVNMRRRTDIRIVPIEAVITVVHEFRIAVTVEVTDAVASSHAVIRLVGCCRLQKCETLSYGAIPLGICLGKQPVLCVRHDEIRQPVAVKIIDEGGHLVIVLARSCVIQPDIPNRDFFKHSVSPPVGYIPIRVVGIGKKIVGTTVAVEVAFPSILGLAGKTVFGIVQIEQFMASGPPVNLVAAFVEDHDVLQPVIVVVCHKNVGWVMGKGYRCRRFPDGIALVCIFKGILVESVLSGLLENEQLMPSVVVEVCDGNERKYRPAGLIIENVSTLLKHLIHPYLNEAAIIGPD